MKNGENKSILKEERKKEKRKKEVQRQKERKKIGDRRRKAE